MTKMVLRKRMRSLRELPTGNRNLIVQKKPFRSAMFSMPAFETDIKFFGTDGMEFYDGITVQELAMTYRPRWDVGDSKSTFQLYAYDSNHGISPFTGGNVYDNGDICWGKNSLPFDPKRAWISFWESSFNRDLVNISSVLDSFTQWFARQEGLRVPHAADPRADMRNLWQRNFSALFPDSALTALLDRGVRRTERIRKMVNRRAPAMEKSSLDMYCFESQFVSSRISRIRRRLDKSRNGKKAMRSRCVRYRTDMGHLRTRYVSTKSLRRTVENYNWSYSEGWRTAQERYNRHARVERLIRDRINTKPLEEGELLRNIRHLMDRWERYYYHRYRGDWHMGRYQEAGLRNFNYDQGRSRSRASTTTDMLGYTVRGDLRIPGIEEEWPTILSFAKARAYGAFRGGWDSISHMYHRYTQAEMQRRYKTLWSDQSWRGMLDYYKPSKWVGTHFNAYESGAHGIIEFRCSGREGAPMEMRGLYALLRRHPSMKRVGRFKHKCPTCGITEGGGSVHTTMRVAYSNATSMFCDCCGETFPIDERAGTQVEIEPHTTVHCFSPYWTSDDTIFTVFNDTPYKGVLIDKEAAHPYFIWGELAQEGMTCESEESTSAEPEEQVATRSLRLLDF